MMAQGARVIESPSELHPGEYAVIRSHGVGEDVYDEEIEALGNPLIDATCPFVSRIHKIAAEKRRRGL